MFNLTPWRKKGNGEGAMTQWQNDPFTRMREEFQSVFDRFFRGFPAPFEGNWSNQPFWGLDLDENDKEYVVRAETPGFEPNDFDVQISGDVVTIKAERQKETGAKKDDYHFAERHSFQRSVTLPVGADTQNVAANYKNGVLELHFPKMPEAQARRIEVK